MNYFEKAHKYDADNIMLVERWKQYADPDNEYSAIQKKRYKNGDWKIEITIPRVNKTISGKSKDVIGLILQLADQAVGLIDNYIKAFPWEILWKADEDHHYYLIPTTSLDDYLIIEEPNNERVQEIYC